MGQTVETLVVPATEDGLGRAAAAFEAFAVRQALPDEPRRRFLLALDELFSNIVRHGRPDPATIGLRFSWGDQVLEMALTDSAGPFNPLERPAPDTTSPLEARQPGGVGIALVRAFMDDVRYERRDGRNVVTLSARLPSMTAGE
jgi:anti-sigma regulatory factor (Ser/Thr protein kinase)